MLKISPQNNARKLWVCASFALSILLMPSAEAQQPAYGACVPNINSLSSSSGGNGNVGLNDINNSQNCSHVVLEPSGPSDMGWPGSANQGACSNNGSYQYGAGCGGVMTVGSSPNTSFNSISMSCPDVIRPTSAVWNACRHPNFPNSKLPANCWSQAAQFKNVNFSIRNRSATGTAVIGFNSNYPGIIQTANNVGLLFEAGGNVPTGAGHQYFQGWPTSELGQTIPPLNFPSVSNYCTSGTSKYGWAAAVDVPSQGPPAQPILNYVSMNPADFAAISNTNNTVFVVEAKDAELNNGSLWTQRTRNPAANIDYPTCTGTDPNNGQSYTYKEKTVFSGRMFSMSQSPCSGWGCAQNEMKVGRIGTFYDFWQQGPNYAQGFGNYVGNFNSGFLDQSCNLVLVSAQFWYTY